MFEMTLIKKVMLGGLGLAHLWFLVWLWKNTPRKGTKSNFNYKPSVTYWGQIRDTKKEFGK